MSLVGVYDLMETGIGIPSNLMSTEEAIVVELSNTAKLIAKRYHNPYRWTLDKEEIFAELQIEVVKAINIYLSENIYSEFLTIARSMLWNRMREMLSRVYGTRRKHEYTAYSLSEEMLEEGGQCDDAFTLFLMFEFMDRLSDTAKRVLKTVLDPDDRMQSAIFDYISRRGKLYKKGAGVYRIPLPVIQAGIDEDPKKIKKAYNEIRKELKKERSVMTIGMGINFSDKLVTWQEVKIYDKPVSYLRWMKSMLKEQCEFRGIYEEGFGRKEMVKVMREDDKKRGIPSDESLPLYNEGLESHLPKNGNGKENKTEKESTKVKADVIDDDKDWVEEDDGPNEEDDDDDGFVSVEDLKKKHEKSSSVKKELIEEDKKTEEKIEIKKSENTEIDLTKKSENVDIVAGLMNLLREGETLRIKKIGENEWTVSLER